MRWCKQNRRNWIPFILGRTVSQDFFVTAEKSGIVRKSNGSGGIGGAVAVEQKLLGADDALVVQITGDGCAGGFREDRIQIIFA